MTADAAAPSPAAPRRARYPAGVELVRQNEPGTAFFVLLHGAVEVVRDGRPLMVFSHPGTFLGELAALTGIPRTATLRAVEASEVAVISEPIEAALRGDERILKRLLAALESRMRHLEERLLRYDLVVFQRAADRLAYLVLTHGGVDLAGHARTDRSALLPSVENALERNAGIPEIRLLDEIARYHGVRAQFDGLLRAEFRDFVPFGRRPPLSVIDPIGPFDVEAGLAEARALAARIADGDARLSAYLADPTHEVNREDAAAALESSFDPEVLRSILLGVFLRLGLKGSNLAKMRHERLHFEGILDRAVEELERRERSGGAIVGPSPFRAAAARAGLEEAYMEALRVARGGAGVGSGPAR